MKTPGQKLYEWEASHIHSRGGNLPRLVSWDFLNDATREVWHKKAVGHYIFCEKSPNRLKNGVNTRSTGYPEVWVNR